MGTSSKKLTKKSTRYSKALEKATKAFEENEAHLRSIENGDMVKNVDGQLDINIQALEDARKYNEVAKIEILTKSNQELKDLKEYYVRKQKVTSTFETDRIWDTYTSLADKISKSVGDFQSILLTKLLYNKLEPLFQNIDLMGNLNGIMKYYITGLLGDGSLLDKNINEIKDMPSLESHTLINTVENERLLAKILNHTAENPDKAKGILSAWDKLDYNKIQFDKVIILPILLMMHEILGFGDSDILLKVTEEVEDSYKSYLDLLAVFEVGNVVEICSDICGAIIFQTKALEEITKREEVSEEPLPAKVNYVDMIKSISNDITIKSENVDDIAIVKDAFCEKMGDLYRSVDLCTKAITLSIEDSEKLDIVKLKDDVESLTIRVFGSHHLNVKSYNILASILTNLNDTSMIVKKADRTDTVELERYIVETVEKEEENRIKSSIRNLMGDKIQEPKTFVTPRY